MPGCVGSSRPFSGRSQRGGQKGWTPRRWQGGRAEAVCSKRQACAKACSRSKPGSGRMFDSRRSGVRVSVSHYVGHIHLPRCLKKMNYRRGLFRFWIIVSASWSIGYVLLLYYYASLCNGYADYGDHRCYTVYSAFFHDVRLWIIPSLPWLLTAAGIGVRWVVRGFRPN